MIRVLNNRTLSWEEIENMLNPPIPLIENNPFNEDTEKIKDFQSERLKLRYKNNNGEKKLLHTLNGSSLALPRLMAGLIEINQVLND